MENKEELEGKEGGKMEETQQQMERALPMAAKAPDGWDPFLFRSFADECTKNKILFFLPIRLREKVGKIEITR